jgi:hypothetical protein
MTDVTKIFDMAEMTVQEAVMAFEAITILAQTNMPAKTAYWIARNTKELQKESKLFNETRDTLIKKYGEENEQKQVFVYPIIDKVDTEGVVEKDSNGNPIKIENPKFISFQKEINEILEQKISVRYSPISIEAFEKVELKPAQLQALLFMLGDN